MDSQYYRWNTEYYWILPENSKKSLFLDDFVRCFTSDKSSKKCCKSTLKRVFTMMWSGNCILVFLYYQNIQKKKWDFFLKILKILLFFWKYFSFRNRDISSTFVRLCVYIFCVTNHVSERREIFVSTQQHVCMGGNNAISVRGKQNQMHRRNISKLPCPIPISNIVPTVDLW